MATTVQATAFGGPEVLSVIDEPLADPARGEVTIRGQAAGVNPFDCLRYSGAFGEDPALLPMRLGQELSGVVTAVGPHTAGPAGPLRVGDEVVAYSQSDLGAYATEVTCSADIVVPKPATLGWETAAGLLFAGAAAVHSLTATQVGADDTVLIHGAGGSVGAVASQLAIIRGARVIGTDSPTRHQMLREYGVEPVEYGSGLADRLARLAPQGFTAAIDAAGSDEAIDVSLQVVADRARIATLVAFERGARVGIKTLGNAGGATDSGARTRANAWTELLPLAAEGRLVLPIARTFALTETAAAHDLALSGDAGGKIILIP